MAFESDTRKEEMQLEINRALLFNYGNNIVLSHIKESSLNKYELSLDYNKIFHVSDEKTKTIFVRNVQFKNVYSASLKFKEKLELPLDEINSTIVSEYTQLRNSIISKKPRKKLNLMNHLIKVFVKPMRVD